jgi:hypothetical protein
LKKRYTISEYEALWQNDPQGFGCVSIQQAVDSLQMDPQAVLSLMDKGALECFEVGEGSEVRNRVTLRSLLRFKAAKTAASSQDRPKRILSVLLEAARSKKTLPFGDVMQTMGLTYPDAVHRQIFKKDLREAVRQSELYAQGVLISALLVFKIQPIAEDDFFLMAQELGLFTPGKDSKTVFFKNQLERIFQYYEER